MILLIEAIPDKAMLAEIVSAVSEDITRTSAVLLDQTAVSVLDKRRQADRERKRTERANAKKLSGLSENVQGHPAPLVPPSLSPDPKTLPPIIPPPPREPKRKPPSLFEENEADQRFEKFWAVYPKRDGSANRKGAEKSFKTALRKASFDEILAGAKAYRDDQQARGKVGTEYVAQAQTWLNQERWSERAINGTLVNGKETLEQISERLYGNQRHS